MKTLTRYCVFDKYGNPKPEIACAHIKKSCIIRFELQFQGEKWKDWKKLGYTIKPCKIAIKTK